MAHQIAPLLGKFIEDARVVKIDPRASVSEVDLRLAFRDWLGEHSPGAPGSPGTPLPDLQVFRDALEQAVVHVPHYRSERLFFTGLALV